MYGGAEFEWDGASISRLRALWAEGLSTAEIGRSMQRSKNAIVGKAHRLGLPARPSPIRRDGEAAPAKAPRPLPPPRRTRTLPVLPSLEAQECGAGDIEARGRRIAAPPKRPVVETSPAKVPVTVAAKHGCRWPTWTIKDAAYLAEIRRGRTLECGAMVRMKTDERGNRVPCVYCDEHTQRAFVKTVPGYATGKQLRQMLAAPPEATAAEPAHA